MEKAADGTGDGTAPEIAAMFARHGARYRWWAVVTVMLGTFAAVMEATIVNVAMPEIIRSFGVGHDQVQLLSTGFLAAMTASMLLAGWAIGRFGQRKTYIAALWLLMTFSVLAALMSPGHFGWLAACRIAQGAIAGFIQPVAMVTLVSVFPLEERGRAMSAYGLGIVLSPAIGPMVGGLLVDDFGWRAVFLVTVPFCLTAAVLAPRFVIVGRPRADAARRRLDMAGLALLVVALACLLAGLSWIFAAPAAASLPLIGIGLAAAVAFIVWERRTPHPLLDFRILRHKGFSAAIIVSVAYGMGLYGSTFLVPLFAQGVAHFSAFESGAMLVPGGVLLALVLVIAGRLTDRMPPHRIVVAGFACFAVSSALLGLTVLAAGFWLISAWVALGRIGLGLIIPGLNAGALRLLPPGTETAGSATINFFRMFGGAFGVTLLALFLEWRQRSYAADATAQGLLAWAKASHGFAEGFFLVAFFFALAMIAARRMVGASRPSA